jgi:hypothetical protein
MILIAIVIFWIVTGFITMLVHWTRQRDNERQHTLMEFKKILDRETERERWLNPPTRITPKEMTNRKKENPWMQQKRPDTDWRREI